MSSEWVIVVGVIVAYFVGWVGGYLAGQTNARLDSVSRSLAQMREQVQQIRERADGARQQTARLREQARHVTETARAKREEPKA